MESVKEVKVGTCISKNILPFSDFCLLCNTFQQRLELVHSCVTSVTNLESKRTSNKLAKQIEALEGDASVPYVQHAFSQT